MSQMDPSKSHALLGPGAIGLYYSALLIRSGVDLHVLARSDLDALTADGITLRRMDPKTSTVLETSQVRPASVAARASDLPQPDRIIIAAKATFNEALLESLRVLVRPGHTELLTLQNGMGNAEFFAGHFPENPILAGLCFVCANRTAPGVVENYHPGRVEVGALGNQWPDAAAVVVSDFNAAGIKTTFTPELDAALWRKLCWNVPFNGLAIAGGGMTTDRILADPRMTRRARHLMEEVRTASERAGFPISDAFIQGQFDVTEKMGAYRPSSLIDYQAGRPVEVEAIWGEPLRRGLALGVVMPELEKVYGEVCSAGENT